MRWEDPDGNGVRVAYGLAGPSRLPSRAVKNFRRLTLDALRIDDERSFRHVGLYEMLRSLLERDGYRFRVPPVDESIAWDDALFLNLTFWDPTEAGDVLVRDRIPADTVAHVAWHHAANRALPVAKGTRPSADVLFLGESIASAFDLYLVGRLIGHAPDSEFLETQVPAMADVAESAGLEPEAFEALLQEVGAEPERAFEDLRALLFDAATACMDCRGIDDARIALHSLRTRRFGALLHHYALSNWVLFARAYADPARDERARAIDATLRAAPDALAWLEANWLGA
jgi:hypothetical protein